jgi:hypothetical protein
LRRFHFHPKPRGRPKGDDLRRRRAGSAGGDDPSIATLKKYWLRAVNVSNSDGIADDEAEADEAERDQRLRGDDAPPQARGDRRHRRRRSSLATDDDDEDVDEDDEDLHIVGEEPALLSPGNLAQALRQAARRGDIADEDIYRYRDIWRRFSSLAGEVAPEGEMGR